MAVKLDLSKSAADEIVLEKLGYRKVSTWDDISFDTTFFKVCIHALVHQWDKLFILNDKVESSAVKNRNSVLFVY